ncbi:MAG: hypothetical protein N2314_09080 [Brevinematales bacterium]|nr:hypothetical protein [Brevinematales bacterium]
MCWGHFSLCSVSSCVTLIRVGLAFGVGVALAYGEFLQAEGIEVYLLGERTNVSSVVWIFPGYITEGDAYQQRPEHIVRFWQLDTYPSHILFVFPVMSQTIYPLYEGGEIASWIEKLQRFRREILRISGQREIFVGISSGVEGTIKFMFPDKKGVFVWFSGTFDYASLDKSSGEYALHERVFGRWGSRWYEENPINLLSSYEGRAYIFCEKRSLFYRQQHALLRNAFSSFQVFPVYVGAWESRHDWGFWGDKRVKEKLRNLILQGNMD